MPTIILVLFLSWAVFFGAVGWLLWRGVSRRSTTPLPVFLLLSGGALGLLMSQLFSPGIPVLSTFTGLGHIASAVKILRLEWFLAFPPGYPLTVPSWAAVVMSVVGEGPEGFSLATQILAAVGIVGCGTLSWVWFGRVWAVVATMGMLAVSPLLLLFAGSDALSVGAFALAPWVVVFAVGFLRATDGSRGHLLGLVSSSVLFLQTRPESPLPFLVLPLVVWGVVGKEHRPWRKLNTAVWMGAILILPYGLMTASHLFLGEGVHNLHLYFIPWVLTILVFLAMAESKVWKSEVGLERLALSVALGAVLILGWLYAGLYSAGWSFFSPGLWRHDSFGGNWSLLTVLFWVFNPKLVPFLVILVVLATLASPGLFGSRFAGMSLVLLFASFCVASLIKGTGAIPFFGARTQLATLVPFSLVFGVGMERLVRTRSRGTRWAIIALVLFVPLPFLLANVSHLDYAPQREYRFLRGAVAQLPPGSSLFLPDDELSGQEGDGETTGQGTMFDLFRCESWPEGLGIPEEAGLKVEPMSRLLDGVEEDFDADKRFVYLGLACLRTGGTGERASCTRVQKTFALELQGEVQIPVVMYEADFLESIGIVHTRARLGLYRVVGLR